MFRKKFSRLRMLDKKGAVFLDLKRNISRILKASKEISALSGDFEKKENSEDKKEIDRQIKMLQKELGKISGENISILENMSLVNPLNNYGLKTPEKNPAAPKSQTKKAEIQKSDGNYLPRKKSFLGNFFRGNTPKVSGLEKETLKRVVAGENRERKIEKIGLKKPSVYIKKPNQMFSEGSAPMIK